MAGNNQGAFARVRKLAIMRHWSPEKRRNADLSGISVIEMPVRLTPYTDHHIKWYELSRKDEYGGFAIQEGREEW